MLAEEVTLSLQRNTLLKMVSRCREVSSLLPGPL